MSQAVGRLSTAMLAAADTVCADLEAERAVDRTRAAKAIAYSLRRSWEQPQLDQIIAELRTEIAEPRELLK